MTPYERAGAALADATHLVIAAGAGASADSGMLVFSQVSSLPALRRQGKTYDQVASLDSFARSPASFYGFWLATMRGYREGRPHAGYDMIKQWCDSLRDFFVQLGKLDVGEVRLTT